MANNVGVERKIHDNRVQTRPVERARRVRLLRVERERVVVDVALRHVGVVLPRLHLTEVLAFHRREAVQVVHLEADLNDRVSVDRHDIAEVVHTVGRNQRRVANNLEGALRLRRERNGRGERRAGARVLATARRRADTREVEPLVGRLVGLEAGHEDELHHRVVEQEVQLRLRTVGVRGLVPLDRVDELVEHALGKAVALGHVEVDILGLHAGLKVRVGELAVRVGAGIRRLVDLDVNVRDNDEVLELLKVNSELDTMEGKRNERERVAGNLRVPERQRDIQALRAARVRDELLTRLELANHVLKALARLAGELLKRVQVLGVERVDDVAADDQANSLEQGKADRVDPVSVEAAERVRELGRRLRAGHVAAARRGRAVENVRVRRRVASLDLGVQAGNVDNNVLTVDQIARAVQRDGRRSAAKLDRVLERLLNRLSGKVRVRRMLQTPVSNRGRTREVEIGRAARNNLRNGTTLRGTRGNTRTNNHG